MIGNSVVPGLPNRWVMPSSLSSARKAERPVIRFFMSPPAPGTLPPESADDVRSRLIDAMERGHGCPARQWLRAARLFAALLSLRLLTFFQIYVINRLRKCPG